jgi:hypothetical protein
MDISKEVDILKEHNAKWFAFFEKTIEEMKQKSVQEIKESSKQLESLRTELACIPIISFLSFFVDNVIVIKDALNKVGMAHQHFQQEISDVKLNMAKIKQENKITQKLLIDRALHPPQASSPRRHRSLRRESQSSQSEEESTQPITAQKPKLQTLSVSSAEVSDSTRIPSPVDENQVENKISNLFGLQKSLLETEAAVRERVLSIFSLSSYIIT